MSQGQVRLERHGPIAVLTLDRPERKNALSHALLEELRGACATLAADAGLRAVVLTGAGQAFSAGADISPGNPEAARLLEAIEKRDLPALRAFAREMRTVLDGVAALPVPVIAAIEGVAYGGGAELSLACDLRVAAEGSVLCFSETRLGLMPDLGGTVRLRRLCGLGRAKDLIFTARKLSAAEALALGLVERAVPAGQALPMALEIAGEMAARGPTAIRTVKRVLARSEGLPLEEALEVETDGAAEVFLSRDFFEGVQAFFEKRPPRWP
jgi:enoyl-CoA hydratase/carnithine racemase